MSRVVKRLENVRHQDGGEKHTGWLPAGAAMPLPTPIRHLILNLEIQDVDGGYLLIGESRDGAMFFDNWFNTLEAAQTAAEEWFGVQASQWRDVQGDA